MVRPDEKEDYIDFITDHYESFIQEGHMLAYGNLNKLNTSASKYNAFIARKNPEDGKWEPDIDREMYYVRNSLSPPPRAYGPVTNWNTASVPSIGKAMDMVVLLGNETLVSEVRPFKALPLDEHKGLHTNDTLDHPHSFVYHPIQQDMSQSSEVVGTLTAAIAWDASMRNLLPNNVKGIFCVVHNNCNQSYSYEIDGKEAFYKGAGDS